MYSKYNCSRKYKLWQVAEPLRRGYIRRMKIPKKSIDPFNTVGIPDARRILEIFQFVKRTASIMVVESKLKDAFRGLKDIPPRDINLVMPLLQGIAEELGSTKVSWFQMGENAAILSYTVDQDSNEQVFVIMPV